jgi:outer membrane biosynthesis protein TonB
VQQPGPGWSQVAPNAPGWGPAAGAPPPSSGGRGTGIAVVAILAIALIAGGAAFVLIAKPFGGGAAASPSATASAAAARPTKAATPSPTRAPTLSPTPKSTPAPTAEPTPPPTAPPTPQPTPGPTPSLEPTVAPTPEPSLPAGTVCRSDRLGVTVTYPKDWYAYEGDPQWTCLLFDPNPIKLDPNTEISATIQMMDDGRTFAAVTKDYATASVYTVKAKASLTVDGLPAVGYQLENTGQGYYPKGILQTVFVIDRGSRGTLVAETVGKKGAAYDANVKILELMVGNLKIDK